VRWGVGVWPEVEFIVEILASESDFKVAAVKLGLENQLILL
jgi:hypothetical protein